MFFGFVYASILINFKLKISLQGRDFNYFCVYVVNMTCRIPRFLVCGFFQLNPLATIFKLRILRRIVTNQIRRCKQIVLGH
jgi:hypothetical protein